jgi:hypothetical protein
MKPKLIEGEKQGEGHFLMELNINTTRILFLILWLIGAIQASY